MAAMDIVTPNLPCISDAELCDRPNCLRQRRLRVGLAEEKMSKTHGLPWGISSSIRLNLKE